MESLNKTNPDHLVLQFIFPQLKNIHQKEQFYK